MDDINAWQFAVVVMASYLGGGLFQFPRELIDFAGPDAEWAYLLLSAVFFGILWLFLEIAAIDPDHSFAFLVNRLLTPLVGWPLQIFRIGLYWGLTVITLANFGAVMETFFLPSTPPFAIETVLAATALYVGWYGTAVLARTIETIFMPTLLGSLAIGLLLTPHFRYAWALVPSVHLASPTVLAGAYHSAYLYIGFEMVVQLYSRVRPERRQAARRWALGMFLLSVGFFGFGYVVSVAVSSPSGIASMQWPPVSALRMATLSGFFVNKLGLLVVVLWGLFSLAFIAVRFWAIAHAVAESANHQIATRRYHIVALATALTTLLGAHLISNVVILVNLLQVYGLPLFVSYLIGLPLLLLLANRVRLVFRHRRRRPAPAH